MEKHISSYFQDSEPKSWQYNVFKKVCFYMRRVWTHDIWENGVCNRNECGLTEIDTFSDFLFFKKHLIHFSFSLDVCELCFVI